MDRTQAEALRGTELYVARGQLPEPEENEFYHADLVGLQAVDEGGQLVGTVVAIQNFGADDLIEIRVAGSNQTEFLPFTKRCVPDDRHCRWQDRDRASDRGRRRQNNRLNIINFPLQFDRVEIPLFRRNGANAGPQRTVYW